MVAHHPTNKWWLQRMVKGKTGEKNHGNGKDINVTRRSKWHYLLHHHEEEFGFHYTMSVIYYNFYYRRDLMIRRNDDANSFIFHFGDSLATRSSSLFILTLWKPNQPLSPSFLSLSIFLSLANYKQDTYNKLIQYIQYMIYRLKC